MYCKHCNKEIDDNSTFCKHCGTNQEEVNITEANQERKSDKMASISVNKGCLKTVGIISAIVAIVVSCCLFFPLDNDKECYKAGVEAHEALKALAIYGENYDCSSSCPVCHPLTWRWDIRKKRWGWK